MRHRKQNYVVGFGGVGQCVYGKDEKDERYTNKVASYIQPMTRREAEVAAKQLTRTTANRYVFKLVPVLCIE